MKAHHQITNTHYFNYVEKENYLNLDSKLNSMEHETPEDIYNSIIYWIEKFKPIISSETMSLHYWKSYMGYTDKFGDMVEGKLKDTFTEKSSMRGNRNNPQNLQINTKIKAGNFWHSMLDFANGKNFKEYAPQKKYNDFKNNAGGYWNHYIFFSSLLMYNGGAKTIKEFDNIPATKIANYLQRSFRVGVEYPILTLPIVESNPYSYLSVLISAQYGSVNGLRNEIINKGMSVFGSGWVWVLAKRVKDALDSGEAFYKKTAGKYTYTYNIK